MPFSGKYLLSFIWALDLQKRRARKNVGAAICRPAGMVWGVVLPLVDVEAADGSPGGQKFFAVGHCQVHKACGIR